MSSNSGWPQAVPETPPLPAPTQLSGANDAHENPPWDGWDVARIGLLLFVVPYLLIPFAGLAAQKLFYRGLPWITVAQKPWLALSTQFLWYAVVAVYMIVFVEGRFHQSFWNAVRWNWPPRRNWPFLIVLGMILVSLQTLVRFFHVPKHMPMEEFLSTPIAAFMTGLLAISLGPLMEELFFRGFLYPVIARRFGVISGVVATSIAFGFIHAAQLAFAWGLVFIIFLVGVVLTIVRAKTRSVGSSLLVHVAYNSTLVLSGVLSSHHLDKIVR